MRDSRRMQEQLQVRVDRARIVWLTLGFLVSLGLTFALGFITGRRAERIEPEGPPVDVITQIDSDKRMHDELTFYAKLNETAPDELDGGGRSVQPRRPTPAPARVTPAPARVTPAPVAEAPAAVASPAKPAPKKGKLGSAVDRARRAARHVDPKRVERALGAGPAQPGDYTVQVSAFQSLGEAKAYGSGLERKGFRPFIVTSMIQGRGTWYRVRIGRFEDEKEAEQAKMVLAQAAIPAWVLRME